jgi:hypothetical protein
MERLLTSVADYVGANDNVQQPRPNQVIARHIQNPALRSFPRGGETNDQSHETIESRTFPELPFSSIVSPPPDSSSEREFVRYYEGISGTLQNTVLEKVMPSISDETRKQLCTLLRQEMNAQRMLDEAKSAAASAQQNDGEREQNHLANMHTILQQVEEDLSDFSLQVLGSVDAHLSALSETSEWQLALLQSTILHRATTQLAAYASQGHVEARKVHTLLHDASLMKSLLLNGGPKAGQFLSMLSIYYNILDASHRAKSGSTSNDIFHRLALAVALEHASPMKVFDTNDIIDPIGRYTHYENAYLKGELDPSFPILNVWELRMVVNCDASNDEIEWCRNMLRNYRPDHIIERNEQWKYCMIVKSDVRYKCPEWAPNTPRTYKQMISGGGKCGPRAWFGRFACKSFGVPTWGVRQPAHAAMSKWTPNNGWIICLGGPNWKKSYWEDCNGVEFDIEARARNCHDLYQKVLWLDCFAAINGEGSIGSRNRQHYQTRSVEQRFWSELSMLQKKSMAACVEKESYPRQRDDKQVKTLVESIIGHQTASAESILIEPGGRIIIPAGASLTPKSAKVIYMKSFNSTNSGHQAHLQEDGSLEFQIRTKQDQSYRLVARVVNVHANPGPLKLLINSSSSKKDYVIEIPYTEGYWTESKNIEVHLPAGMNRLRFYREEGLGLTIKEFLLAPL